MFNASSANKEPGMGVMEFIVHEERDSYTYKELKKIPEWRKKLSNEYRFELQIDDNTWGSVELYCISQLYLDDDDLFKKLLIDGEYGNDSIKIADVKQKIKLKKEEYSESSLLKALTVKFTHENNFFKDILRLTKNARLTHYKRGYSVVEEESGLKRASPTAFTNILEKIREDNKQEAIILQKEINIAQKESLEQQAIDPNEEFDPSSNEPIDPPKKGQKKLRNPKSFVTSKVSNHNAGFAEVKILTKKEVGDYDDLISKYRPNLNKSNNTLTLYEKTNIIGLRMEQLAFGCDSFLTSQEENELRCVKKIALAEFDKRKLPFIVCRLMPDSTKEYWKLEDMK
jgi:DNA-directed RNA polymerase subunit K/omega